jgi:hypothetical protein
MLHQKQLTLEESIIIDLAGFAKNPLGFVLYSFPWSEPAGELANEKGPDQWQVEILEALGKGLLSPNEAILIAAASGHGVGKSALVSWIIMWALATYEDTKIVITANTEGQLQTKTRAEFAKWYRLFIGNFMFKLTATACFSRDEKHAMTWRADFIPWSEENPEAFAGLHNKGKRIVLIFDEASSIADIIWETSEGALTDADTEIIWCAFGNMTRNTGRFTECFGRFSNRWKTWSIDSRTVKISNKKQIAKWVEDYGEDSDFVRTRVRGLPPRSASMQFIPNDAVVGAMNRPLSELYNTDPLIIGVDVARFGDDNSVIFFRQGRDARTRPPLIFRGIDTVTLAEHVANNYNALQASAVFVDGTGVGGGVVDNLRRLGVPVHDINFARKSDNSSPAYETAGVKYANKRAEMWGAMLEWLRRGSIPNNQEWLQQFINVNYDFNKQGGIQLESKADIKARSSEGSPDIADALALTFAYPVVSNLWEGRTQSNITSDYDPLALAKVM